MADGSTIYALSSAPGRAAVAVVRISGPAVGKVLACMAPPMVADRMAAFRRIVHPETGQLLDQAVVLYFAAPRSETGEDIAEFQLHGGRAVVRSVLDALGTVSGCRLAEPGEFAHRAFRNGKIDLVEVEGLADLVDAETEGQRRAAIDQAGGVQSRLYESWRGRLVEMAALAEAAIDFSDEQDVAVSAVGMAREKAAPLLTEIRSHLDDGHRGEILREGFRVALLGPPNAGKSSLLNALARRQAAIVSEEAGTTRDVIAVRLDLGGLPVVVSDTAGIRDAVGAIEREGIRRSFAAAREADLVIWLSESDFDSPPSEISRETCLPVRTKIDLTQFRRSQYGSIGISSTTGAGLEALTKEIARRAATAVGDTACPALMHARHRQHLESAAASLATFLNGDPAETEIRAEDLRLAIHALGRITGRVDVEDVLGEIFGRFCIGK